MSDIVYTRDAVDASFVKFDGTNLVQAGIPIPNVGGSNTSTIALDTDGTPFYSPQGTSAVALDTDGNPYVTDAAMYVTAASVAATYATQAQVAATYVPVRGFGPRIVWLGDSITEGSNDNDHQSIGQSYPLMAQLALQGKGITVRNAGIQGNTSAQMLARFDTDVTPYSPTVVPILAGTNDIGAGVSLATFQANITAIVAKIRAIGATPVLATIPPNNVTARIAPTALFNLWLTRYAAMLGAPLIDLHAILTDSATGVYKTGYSTDGTHPAAAPQNLMGQAAAAVLGAYLRPWSPPLVHENTDTIQILGTNPLYINDSNSDGCPDGWDHYGDSNVTVSLVTDAQVPGKMAKLTAAGATGIHVLENYISTGYTTGDTLAVAGVLTTDGGIQTQIKIDFQSSGQNAFPVNATPTVTRGVFYQEVIVPAGTGAIGFQIISGAGTGTIQVGQFTVYNLTALGLA